MLSGIASHSGNSTRDHYHTGQAVLCAAAGFFSSPMPDILRQVVPSNHEAAQVKFKSKSKSVRRTGAGCAGRRGFGQAFVSSAAQGEAQPVQVDVNNRSGKKGQH